MLDHLVYAAPDLEAAVNELEQRLGVRPAPGGKHPQWGTKNFLLALGPKAYLEIIGPDPEAAAPAGPRPFGIDGSTEPRLATWVARPAGGMDAAVANAKAAGYDPGPITDGRRERPDGVVLQWRLTPPNVSKGDGILPFLIEWGDCPHPAESTPKGCTLVDLRATHPEADVLQPILRALGTDLNVHYGDAAMLMAIIDTPNGRRELL